MGWDLFAYCKLPYLGSWDVNFPGIVYLHAVSIALLGRSDLAFRIFDLIFEFAACLLLYKILVRWFPTAIAVVASVIYALLYVSLAWPAAGQRDAFAVFFLLAGVELLLESESEAHLRTTLTIASGFFIAFCALIRPTFGLWPVSVCVADLLVERRLDRRLWEFLAGCGIALLALLLPYALETNGLRDFYRFAILFNLDVYSQYTQPASVFISAPQVTGQLAAFFSAGGLLTLAGMRLQKSGWFPRNVPTFVIALYVLLFMSSIVSIFVMHSFFLYQYLPLLLLLSPVMAYAVFLPALLRRPAISVPLTAVLMIYLGYRLYPRNFVHDYRRAVASGQPILDYVYSKIDSDSMNGYGAEAKAVAYLRKADSEKRPIEVICYNRPYLREIAGLEAATRFSEILPLTIPARGDTFTSYQQEWRKEFVERVQTVRPKFIVFVHIQGGLLTLKSPENLATSIPGFSTLLSCHYRMDTAIRGFTFYKLRATEPKELSVFTSHGPAELFDIDSLKTKMSYFCSAYGNRTRVPALRGRYPSR